MRFLYEQLDFNRWINRVRNFFDNFWNIETRQKIETERALKITVVVFIVTATVIGIVLVWIASRQPALEPSIGLEYGVRYTINQSCLQECERIADKAGEVFQNCVRSCRSL